MQGASALAGFAVVPVLVETLGSAEFGVLTVIVSFGLWLTVLDTGLQTAERLLVGEYRQREGGRAPGALLRRGYVVAIGIVLLNALMVALALVILPLPGLLGSEGLLPESIVIQAVAAFSLPVVLSSLGVVPLGALEGVGRTVAAAMISGLGPIAALPLTLAASRAGGGLVLLAFIQGAAMAVPRFCALVYWRWRPSLVRAVDNPSARFPVRLVAQLALLAGLALAQTGLAPVIVSSALGSDAAATYGIAIRLVIGALVPLTVLTPFIAGALAAARGSGWSQRRDMELVRLLAQGALGGLLAGVALVVLGPVAAAILGRGEVEVPVGVLVAGALYLVASYVATPMQAAFAGPRALRLSVILGIALTAVAIGLSLILTPMLGPAGPLLAAAAAASLSVAFWTVTWRVRPSLLSDVHTTREA
jgi:O-antigen/teichoic acid export membrane protein